MRPLSESAARVSGQCFERKYIALGRIVKQWPEIVGKTLADKAIPVKVNYRKSTNKGGKSSATLDIAVDSAHATLLHYQKDLIIERINNLFGDNWITGIKFVHTPVNSDHNTPMKYRPYAKAPLTLNEKKTLSDMLASVEDEQIQARLNALGQAILNDDKT